MKEIYDTYPHTGAKPEIVTIRFPFTVQRLYEVARLFEGKKVHKDVSFSVDLTVTAKMVAEKFGLKKTLEKSGVLVAETQGQVMWKGKIMDPWVDAKRGRDQDHGDRQPQGLQRHRPAGDRHGPPADSRSRS